MKFHIGKWNLLIAGVLIAFISILQWKRWGINIVQELDDGNFFFLGGPSLWYPTALFPSLVAIGYLITFFCSLGFIEITREGEVLHFYEKNGLIRQKVSLRSDSVTTLSISNTKLRMSAIGAIVLVLSSYYLYIDGISLLTYHAVYGTGIDTGLYYILQASFNVIAIVFVIFFTPGEIRLHSLEIDRIIMQIPIFLTSQKKRDFLFEITQTLDISARGKENSNHGDLLGLIWGVILFTSAILSRVFLVFSNEVLRIIYVFIGILIMSSAIKGMSVTSQKGLWFTETHPKSGMRTISLWFFLEWALIGIITVYTIINNLLYLISGINLYLIILMNCLFGLIVIFPGIWLGVAYIFKIRKKIRA
ncbi:MAG: hypothetical protein EU530_03460 [Promethearchaeota archaeon]|nr:MAG: hypothetical protein EU530_03460 [Candidatus Lokiarchaeota archaeon]